MPGCSAVTVSELRGFRAEAGGREPEDLTRAWSALLAEMRRGGATAGPRRTRAIGPGFPAGLARRQIIRDDAAASPRRPFASRKVMAGMSAAVAAALAGAVAAGLLVVPGHAPAGHHHGLTAQYVLDRAAVAAGAAMLPAPRPDQFVYVHSLDTGLGIEGSSNGAIERAWLTTSDRRIWLSASGYRPGVLRTVTTATHPLPWGGTPPSAGGHQVQWLPLAKLSARVADRLPSYHASTQGTASSAC